MNPETAAERLRESLGDSTEATPEDREDERRAVHADLKEKINLLLWVSLPPTMTMRGAEDVACAIFDLITGSWR